MNYASKALIKKSPNSSTKFQTLKPHSVNGIIVILSCIMKVFINILRRKKKIRNNRSISYSMSSKLFKNLQSSQTQHTLCFNSLKPLRSLTREISIAFGIRHGERLNTIMVPFKYSIRCKLFVNDGNIEQVVNFIYLREEVSDNKDRMMREVANQTNKTENRIFESLRDIKWNHKDINKTIKG